MNLNPIFLLAQAKPDTADPGARRDALKANRGTGTSTDVMVVIGCAAALALILLVWAYFIRRRPKNARGSLVVERRRKGSGREDDSSRQRRRRRRGEHTEKWGRNPTLGETGGLPPARPEEPSTATSLTETQTLSSAPVEPAPEHDRPRIIRPS